MEKLLIMSKEIYYIGEFKSVMEIFKGFNSVIRMKMNKFLKNKFFVKDVKWIFKYLKYIVDKNVKWLIKLYDCVKFY